MSDIVIRAEQIGKKYVIGHSVQNGSYIALRDVLMHKARSVLRWSHDRIQGKPLSASSNAEEFWALRDICFEIRRGEAVGIIGGNGAGKSTLLKILSRITEPTVGSVRIRGRVASLLEVGTGFHPELSGRENIFLNGAIMGMARQEIRSKFDEIVAFAEIEKFLDTPVKRYSSGMYVRLAFAVAAHLDPDILIVDEVLAVGDANFQKKCMSKMESVANREGRTVLFVSHNMAAIRSLCSVAILLDHGRLTSSGGVAEISGIYLNQTVTNQEYSADVASFPRPTHIESGTRITRIDINNGGVLKHGEPASFVLSFDSKSESTEVAFAIGFSSRDGSRIMSVDSDIPGSRMRLRQNTRGKVTLTINTVHLAPDTYMMDLGIRSGDSYMLDYLPSCMAVTVLPSANTPPVIAMRSSGRGGVRYPCLTDVVCTEIC